MVRNPSDQDLRELDAAIEQRIAGSGDYDREGNPFVALPASDKYALARRAGVELDVLEQRLNTLCEVVPEPSGHAAVPRYRLRPTTRPRRADHRR